MKYTVEGWVERNMDRIPESFHETLQSSKNDVRGKFLREAVAGAEGEGARGGRKIS